MAKEVLMKTNDVSVIVCSSSEVAASTCRVCLCRESDQMGDAALKFLRIISPSAYGNNSKQDLKGKAENVSEGDGKCSSLTNSKYKSVEFVSPKGEVFVSNTHVELGYSQNGNKLLELGCACKDDLGLVHYACALKWFVNHGSTVCEVCHHHAKNVITSDIGKVQNVLKEYGVLRKRTENSEPMHILQQNSGMDPDAMAIWRQRLTEVSHWFDPDYRLSTSLVPDEQPSINEELVRRLKTIAKWIAGGTVFLLVTRLLVTFAWLIAHNVVESMGKSGRYILLGFSSLIVVLFLCFFVLLRIKNGRARFWTILLVLSFLEVYHVALTVGIMSS